MRRSVTVRQWSALGMAGLFVAATVALLASATIAYAQGEVRESITMSPTSRKYKADAGTTIKDELTIVNDGSVAYDFLVYARPYSIVDNQYDNPNFTAVTKYADLYAWVQFPETKFHIEAGATKKVPYSIQIPDGVAPGGHYGVIFAETQPSGDDASGNSVLRKKRVGAIMYATVNGEYRNTGEVIGGDIPFWQTQPPLSATVAAKNTGNTDFTDTVRMTVRDVFGNIKYDIKKEYQVLPETSRTMAITWDKAPWFGFYKVQTQQAFLDKTVMSEGYVLLMPRFIPFVVVIIVIIGGLYAWARRRKQ